VRKALSRLLGVLANGPWQCFYCGAPFSSDAEGAAHMRAVHGMQ
jgi:hypothetical protein